MARAIYTYSQIQRDLNAATHGRRTNLIPGDTGDTNLERDLINRGVRIAISEIDFRGNKRKVQLTPGLMDNQFDYSIPLDVKGDRITDFSPQITDSRGEFETWNQVSPEEFDRRKKVEKGLYTIIDDDLDRTLRISADVEDMTLVISEMDGLNSPDTWGGFGSTLDSDVDSENDDFIQGNGAVRFSDTYLQATTGRDDTYVGIENSALVEFDVSPYLSRGSFFVYGKLDTGDTGIKQLNLRLGSDSDAYYTFSDSTQNDCSAFESGWNLVRMDASSRVATGTPTDTAISYAALYWTRDSGTHLDTDFAFDYLTAKKGKYYDLTYYSRYVWQDTEFALSENSTHDTHALLVQNDEYEVISAKIAELASGYLRDREDQKYYAGEYQRLKNIYLAANPSEAGVLTTRRYIFGSQGGTPRDNNVFNDS